MPITHALPHISESRLNEPSIVGQSHPHDSAFSHVSAQARYIDDLLLPTSTLHAAIGMSPLAHANIHAIDLSAVMTAPGLVATLQAKEIPGKNNYGPILQDDPILSDTLVQYVGQPIFAVAATSHRLARQAVRRFKWEATPLPAILDITEALKANSFVIPSQTLVRGEPQKALASSPFRLQSELTIGGQDHFYLEGQIAVAIPQENSGMLIYSSTQHPSEVQHLVALALNLHSHDVNIVCQRMGGAFGGKESQPALIACIAALLAQKTGHPVKLRLDRDDDMIMTGKRHDFLAQYDVGFSATGRINALKIMLASRCGYSADLSGPVNDRTICHVDNAYFLENVEIISHRCKTNTVSNTAFRGFGGPQGMMAIESVMDDIAGHLQCDPLDIRRENFYGIHDRNITPYSMKVEDNVIHLIVDQLEKSSHYQQRRSRIQALNANHRFIKRGIALTPVKFGISFNATHYNQAGALLHLYTDGTLLLNHGGTEMGQGLYTKVMQVVAEELGVPLHHVRTSATDTSKVPNTSATAASSGSDLNGKAAQAAARILKNRLIGFASEKYGLPSHAISFKDGLVHLASMPSMRLAELATAAHAGRISLSATGYYRTPKIHWDRQTLTGRPFFYFSYGAAVVEVAIDGLTGESRILKVDILHDVGSSLNPDIDKGQIEGGFIQGLGWLTSEELWWNKKGELKTHSPSTYKIPTAHDWPLEVQIELLQNEPNREDTIFASKAVGEPPFMLAIAAFQALRDAVSSFEGHAPSIPLQAPATPESLLKAIGSIQTHPSGLWSSSRLTESL